MDWDLEHEVVRGRGGGTKVKYANIGVGCDAGEDIGRVRRKGSGIGAAVCGDRKERLRAMRRPDANSTVPAR